MKASRQTVLLLVVAVHAGALYWFPASRLRVHERVTRDFPSSVLLWLPPPVEYKEESSPVKASPGPARKSRPSAPISVREVATEPAPAASSDSDPPVIDWRAAAESVAREPFDIAAEAKDRRSTSSGENKDFGWSRAATQRVEVMPGGVMIRLNDRCAIVISGLLLPACVLGKIPVRGDLFEHMDDPPEPGDWRDE